MNSPSLACLKRADNSSSFHSKPSPLCSTSSMTRWKRCPTFSNLTGKKKRTCQSWFSRPSPRSNSAITCRSTFRFAPVQTLSPRWILYRLCWLLVKGKIWKDPFPTRQRNRIPRAKIDGFVERTVAPLPPTPSSSHSLKTRSTAVGRFAAPWR